MRVLTRVLAMRDDISRTQTRAKLQEIANAFLDKENPSTHNQAVIGAGRDGLSAAQADVPDLPLADDCTGRDRQRNFR